MEEADDINTLSVDVICLFFIFDCYKMCGFTVRFVGLSNIWDREL